MVRAIMDRLIFLRWVFVFVVVLLLLAVCSLFSPSWAWQQWFKGIEKTAQEFEKKSQELRKKAWEMSKNN